MGFDTYFTNTSNMLDDLGSYTEHGKLYHSRHITGNYIVSEKGFLMTAEFIKEERKFVIEWTTKVQNARAFPNTKGARNLMEKHKIAGFIWQPHKESPPKKGWFIRETEKVNEIEKKGIMYWQPFRAYSTPANDVRFLNNEVSNEMIFETLQDATKKCIELNESMIEDIISRYGDAERLNMNTGDLTQQFILYRQSVYSHINEELRRTAVKDLAERNSLPYGI